MLVVPDASTAVGMLEEVEDLGSVPPLLIGL